MKNIIKNSIICMLTALVAFSCAKDEENLFGTVFGKVTDTSTGEPVRSATITITPGGMSATTGADGSFEFIDLEPGQYEMQVKKDGYTTNTKRITVITGKVASGDIAISAATFSEVIKLSTTSLNFGTSHTELSFNINNTGTAGDVSWTINNVDNPCLTVSPMQSTTAMGKSTAIVVKLDRSQLTEDLNTIITVDAAGGSLPITVSAKKSSGSGGDGGDGGNGGNGGNGGDDLTKVVSNGLYLFFPFENDTKNATETPLNGVAVNNPGYIDSFNKTKAIALNKSNNSSINIPEGLVDSKNNSISFWVKDLQDGHIFSVKTDDSRWEMATAFYFEMRNNKLRYITQGHNFHYQYNNDATNPSFTHGNITDGEWHMITLTSDSSSNFGKTEVRLYIDGEYTDVISVSFITGERLFDIGTRFHFGGLPANNDRKLSAISMKVDNLRIYNNRTITAAEVKTIYDAEK